MSIVLELGSEFLLAEGIWLEAEDLRYGFEHGFLRASAVVEIAVDEVRRGSADSVLREVAGLLRDEWGRLRQTLEMLDDPERIHDPRESKRKWLYLQLKAAYTERDRLDDPLGFVEEIYADFDYPPAIASFVRYMPPEQDAETGERALMQRWANFLEREHQVLANLEPNP